MTWMTRDFRSYPVRCKTFHLKASLNLNDWLEVGCWRKHSEASSEAALLKQYRYLIRKNPGVDFEMDKLMNNHVFRTKVEQNTFGDATLLLIARPPIMTELFTLNPELANLEI